MALFVGRSAVGFGQFHQSSMAVDALGPSTVAMAGDCQAALEVQAGLVEAAEFEVQFGEVRSNGQAARMVANVIREWLDGRGIVAPFEAGRSERQRIVVGRGCRPNDGRFPGSRLDLRCDASSQAEQCDGRDEPTSTHR